MHNFVPQFAMWQVVISKCMIVGYMKIHFYYSQLAMSSSTKLCIFMSP